MSASVWNPGEGTDQQLVSGDNTYKSEAITAIDKQVDFTLTNFAYAVGVESIQVFINGVEQTIDKDYKETNGNVVTLVEPARAGDVIKVRALIGSESSQSAATSAANAAASAVTAQNAADSVVAANNTIIATSASNITIGNGAKVFVVGVGKQFQAGQFVMATPVGVNGTYAVGQVTSYDAGNLTLNITKYEGAGTFNNWNISVSGAPQPVTNIFTDANLLAQVQTLSLLF